MTPNRLARATTWPRVPFQSLLATVVPAVVLVVAAAPAQDAPLPPVDLGALAVRPLGPAAMGGRVVGLAVREDKPATFYVATASGGLWKTVNNGTTFEPLFQNEKVASIGAVALAPTDPDQVWVGTGEANNRNSTSWGNGVYHSKDGGKTWEYKGLPMSLHIGRIAVHPKNPDVVFVAACGSLWGPNPERGLYRTKDGGKTWKQVLRKDSKTGATEVRIDPEQPDVVYCALYERQRDGFDGNHPAKRWGPGSGLYRSSDGGDTWKKITKGLPAVDIGRISMDIYRKDPRYVYAVIETADIGKRPEGAPPPPPRQGGGRATPIMGVTGDDALFGAKLVTVADGGPSAQAGLKPDDVILSLDGKGTTSWDRLVALKNEREPGQKVKLKVLRGRKTMDVEVTLAEGQPAGRGGRGGRGRSRTHPYADRIGGQIANQDQGPNGFQTGGTYMSKDRGETWERINSLNPRPYYFSQIRVDPSDNQNLYVLGIQFWFSFDGGKTFRSRDREITMAGVHVDHHALWINPRDGKHLLLGCDGGVNVTHDRCRSWEAFENLDIGQAYHAVADNRRPYWVYAGYQDNGSWGSPSQTQFSEGVMNSDAFKIGGGDGFVCRVDPEDPNVVFSESQGGNIGWTNIVTGARGRVRKSGRDWNWNTPFLLSKYNSKTIYYAGDRVFKSMDRGRNTVAISDKLTNDRKAGTTTGPSASALHESPRKPGILWVGTDDGNLYVTQDDGRGWTARSKAVHELLPNAQPMWISYVFASHYKDGRAYLAVDGHRSNDRAPYVFATENFGESWQSLAGGLPEDCGSVHAVHEDSRNEDLLYLGTEIGMWASLDRGKSWQRLPKPFPTVAVRDFDIQEREQHLILATHGRSVWALDVRPLRALTKDNREKDAYLVPPGDVLRLATRSRSKQGHRHFRIPNPPTRASFYYWLAKDAPGAVTLTVRDALGNEMWTTKGKTTAGLHRVDWNLRRARAGARGEGGRGARFGGLLGAGRRRGGASAPAGTYAVTLAAGDSTQTATFEVENSEKRLDVSWPRPVGVGEGGPVLAEDEGERVDAQEERRDR